MAVTVSGTFKQDVRIHNGLESIADELIGQPLERRVVVAVVETKRITRDIEDGGSENVTVRLVHVEPLTGGAADTARDLLSTAFKARTGNPPEPTLFDDHSALAASGGGDAGDDESA